MNWLALALGLIQLANKLIEWARAKANYDAELDRLVAQQAAEVLRKTEFGNAALKKVAALSDTELDDLLRSFEQPEAPKR